MLPKSQNLQVETIKYITKKNNSWVYDTDNQTSHEISDINSFLSSNIQFIKISAYMIVNLNYVEGYLLNGTSGFMVISGIKFDVARRYISQVRTVHKIFLNQKYSKVANSEKSKWLSKINPSIDQLNEIGIENIQYLERKGTLTTIHYNDGSKRSFYESLKYFEKIFNNHPFLIRIRRNCIVNVKHTNNYQVNSATKTAKIDIESQKFNISRRQLPAFKRRSKAI
jgi:DNA-binding LytR/AlgR family response regulator